jgi:hypothetical protein
MAGRTQGISKERDIKLLIESRHPLIAVETDEEERLGDILMRLSISMKLPLYTWTSVDGLKRPADVGAPEDSRQPLAALNKIAASRADGLYFFKDLQRFLDNAAIVRRLRNLAPACARTNRAIIMTAPAFELPPELTPCTVLVRLELPTIDELEDLVERVAIDMGVRPGIRIETKPADYRALAEALKGLTLFDAERALMRAIVDSGALSPSDAGQILDLKRQVIERDGVLDFRPRVEDLAAVGGMKHLKAWLATRGGAFGPEAKAFGLDPPKGLLLLGVQGCGKSLCAKAIAHEWNLPLLKLEPGRLYEKYIGESEKSLDRALETAERIAPVVLWIDELEKGFANVSQSETDAGLSKRIFGRLLSWLQDRPAPVFVAATCNDIMSLPPELMRKGRFDEIFFVDLPTADERESILKIHLTRRKRDPGSFDLKNLAVASEGFSGAEIEAAIVSGMYSAFAAKAELTTAVLLKEIGDTRPLSVTRAEEVQSLREWASTRCVPAS